MKHSRYGRISVHCVYLQLVQRCAKDAAHNLGLLYQLPTVRGCHFDQLHLCLAVSVPRALQSQNGFLKKGSASPQLRKSAGWYPAAWLTSRTIALHRA